MFWKLKCIFAQNQSELWELTFHEQVKRNDVAHNETKILLLQFRIENNAVLRKNNLEISQHTE